MRAWPTSTACARAREHVKEVRIFCAHDLLELQARAAEPARGLAPSAPRRRVVEARGPGLVSEPARA
jgi:hypothetical protein